MFNTPQVNPKIIRVLYKQQQELDKHSPDCVNPVINAEDPLDIQADIEGPKGTPYEGGLFRVKLFIPDDFPRAAPKGYFMTKIYHPNVSEKGEICVNTLKRDWNPAQWSLYNLFEVIKCLLIVPFPQSSLNEEAGKIFMENYNEYFRIAKMYTDIHAKKKEGSENINTDSSNINDKVNDSSSGFEHSNSNNSIQYNNNIANNCCSTLNINRSLSMNNCSFNFNFNSNNNIILNNYHRSNSIIENNNNLMFRKSNKNKPNLGYLPFLSSNNIPNLGLEKRNSMEINNANSTENCQDEINKWLMRI